MRIISDARRVILISFSFWAQVLGLVALILPEALFAFAGIEIDPYRLWWIALGLLLFGLAGRLVVQTGSVIVNILRIVAVTALIVLFSFVAAQAHAMGPKAGKTVRTAANESTESKTLAIAVPFIAEKEGIRLTAYQDIVGVWTICAGSTRGIKPGMRKTLDECHALLRAEVAEYRKGMHKYFTDETIRTRLPATRDAAYTSLAFNVGIRGAGRSTAVRRLNDGNIRGGCDAITWWNKAGSRIIRGLVIRRAEERALCLVGV